MLQDRQGQVWMSTHDDVLCFDGLRFYSPKSLGLPPLLGAWTLAEDGTGGIVIGLVRGVHRYPGGRIEQLTDNERPPSVPGCSGICRYSARQQDQ